jgi:alpha-tubulin suppressor-like RCC1 family protein
MSWKMLYNGNCPPPGPEPFKFVYCFSGSDNQLAIDNQGRIYSWGLAAHSYTGQIPEPIPSTLNYLANSAMKVDTGASGDMVVYPYQVGNVGGWKKVQIYERIFVAQSEDNYLYAWGEGRNGSGGWGLTDHYTHISIVDARDRFEPGGDEAIFVTQINNQKWLDFALGYDHIIALEEDNRAYVWGTNFWGYEFGMPAYASGYKSLVPIQVTTLPDTPLKIVSAGGNNSLVVTESDQIYAWGEFAWPVMSTPTLIPLTIPIGVTIIQALATYSGIVVLLSNGDVYCRGDLMQFAPGPDYYFDTLTKIPGGHFFTYISAFENAVGALDNQGNIWGWGQAKGFISRDDSYCDIAVYGPGEEPVFVASPTLGEHKFAYFSVGNITHCGIDTQCRLFCWGSDLWGQLGVNYLPGDSSCSPLQVYNPTLYDGTLAYEAQVSSTGIGVEIIRIREPLPQLSAHDPCGHWHKGGGDTAREKESFDANCWEPTIVTDGTTVLYVITGRHRPNQLYMLLYNIPSNTWSTLIFRKDVLHSNWDGGAAIAGNVYAFHNYAYDIAGEQYNEITSNPRMITYVVGQNLEHQKEWPGTLEMHGRNKVAVRSTGTVVCVVRTSTAWQVQGSNDYGIGFSLIYTLPGNVTDAAVIIDPIDGTVYVAVVDAAVDALRIYSGTSTVTGWSLRSTTLVIDNPHSLRFHVDNGRFFVTVGGPSPSTTRFYYSTDNCSSFTARDLHEYSIYFAATGKLLYNLADAQDWRTVDYEQVVISWEPNPQLETLTDRCTIHNVGQMTVYSQAKLRVDGSEGNIVAILLSRNLGERWQEIKTPLNYYETYEELLNLNDDPRWPFVPQYAKL